jgi:hypothetical protein
VKTTFKLGVGVLRLISLIPCAITYARTVEMLSNSIQLVLQDRFRGTTDVTLHSSEIRIRDYSGDSLKDMRSSAQTFWSFSPSGDCAGRSFRRQAQFRFGHERVLISQRQCDENKTYMVHLRVRHDLDPKRGRRSKTFINCDRRRAWRLGSFVLG